ncbi:MAG TPA: hypothetical protein VKZ83_06145 [Phototrophicaceae bacterium]|nr:hypothetical protein [Phototrophicaceae bacterium]
MPLFEFDAGQLVRAQVGHAVPDPVGPGVLEAVRAQILEILGLPVFPVTWQDDDGAPRLTAMDPSGHVVSIEVLDRLDAGSLVAALGRAGSAGQRGWIDVAESYPRGVGAFRRDWNAFRESQPVGTAVAARVHVVAAAIDDDARQALDALAGAGVVVHELVVRTMSNGRLFLDVTELSHPVAPLPWLLPSRPVIEHPAGPAALASGASGGQPVPGPPAEPVGALPEQDAAAGQHAAPAAADDHQPASVAVDDANRPATAPPEADGEVPAHRAAPDADLLSISASLGAPTPIVWVANGQRGEATLRPDGWIVVGDEHFPAPEAAATAVSGRPVTGDAWGAWRFGEHGPSLREARDELRAVHARARRAAAADGPGLRRRARRRRAASE